MTLYNEAYKKILDAIVSGKFKPGQLLKELELSAELKMSRTPIREALARLERDGLLVKMGRSYMVAYLTKEDVEALYEVRIPLEVAAAKAAAPKAPEHALRQLEETIDALLRESCAASPDPFRLAELSGAFHDLIAEAAGNAYLYEELRRLKLRLKPARVRIFLDVRRRLQEAQEHKAVFEAIRSRDPSRAGRAMEDHEDSVMKYIREVLLR
ncbi:MAG: GntR family transcriptional regulator [Thermoproteus sp. AZ2]|uniref:GntR family transcriptional regulator n=1 Tax=Thermoproteus sp. AZ2 TaxID=1609232 RepID=A0ACC6V339_9CREN|nr:MAG: hypothetical protein TU35_06805 [Thermoproteus sp. AZ2]